MARRNILILHAGALGDFVLSWFIPLALRRLFADHEIVYVTHPSKGDLAHRFLQTSSANIDLGGWHTLFADSPRLHPASAQLLSDADIVISFLSADQQQVARNLRTLAPGITLACVDPLPPANCTSHITAWYYTQLARSLPGECMDEAICELASEGIPAARSAGQRILLHPGAGARNKCWPLDSYLDVAGMIRQRGQEVAFVLGETELEQWPDRTISQLEALCPILRPTDYLALAEELLSTQLLLTNDNGPGHLAGVLGVPVLSLFGPTDPRIWRPVGPRCRTLCAPTLAALPPAAVLQALSTMDTPPL